MSKIHAATGKTRVRQVPSTPHPLITKEGLRDPATPRYDLEERLLEYASSIIRLSEALPSTRAGLHIAEQILRSGTSPLPNHGEAQSSESQKDFVHKMSICLKELRETHCWLKLIKHVPLVKQTSLIDPILTETNELISIFVASIRTANPPR